MISCLGALLSKKIGMSKEILSPAGIFYRDASSALLRLVISANHVKAPLTHSFTHSRIHRFSQNSCVILLAICRPYCRPYVLLPCLQKIISPIQSRIGTERGASPPRTTRIKTPPANALLPPVPRLFSRRKSTKAVIQKSATSSRNFRPH